MSSGLSRFIRQSKLKVRRALSMPQKWMLGRDLPGKGNQLLPNFLCIGAQKAGTSWLMNNLSKHPDVFVPQDLEYYDIHYFDRYFHEPLSRYMQYFHGGETKTKGECTPAYGFMSESRIAWIRKILPDLRVILMIRNPVERAWSHARMNLVSQSGVPFESVSEQQFIDHFHSPESRIRSDYLDMLRRWENHFPAEQILCGFFDDIIAAPKPLLESVLEHIGITRDVDWSQWKLDEVVNPGTRIEIPERLFNELNSIYRKPIQQLRNRFGSRIDAWNQVDGSQG